MKDRIAKERLNIILLVDASKSMSGKRIEQVDAIRPGIAINFPAGILCTFFQYRSFYS